MHSMDNTQTNQGKPHWKRHEQTGQKRIPNVGGFSIISGFSIGVLLSIALYTYLGTYLGHFNPILILAAFSTVLLMGFIGVFDDLFHSIRRSKPLSLFLPRFLLPL